MEDVYEITLEDCDLSVLNCLLESESPGTFVETHRMELALLYGRLTLAKQKDEYHRRNHKIIPK